MALSTRAAAAASTRCELLKAMARRIDRIMDFVNTIVVLSVEQDYLRDTEEDECKVQGAVARWKDELRGGGGERRVG